LREGCRPEEIDLQDASAAQSLDLSFDVESKPTEVANAQPHTTRAFLDDAAMVAAHRNPERWNLLYRVMYRMQEDRNLLKIETDGDVSEMLRLSSQVRRDLHKMHAFVRFRKVVLPEDAGEHFVSWYQPDHRILPLAAPFFAERFAVMRWTILTPDASVSWDPAAKELSFGDGVPRESAPSEDELEVLWNSYYRSIFNPARLNVDAMKSEMPVRYWKNLPEISTLPGLISQSTERVATMVSIQQDKKSAATFVPAVHTLDAIREALPMCRGCDLYCHATQVVAGSGSKSARILLVGEQPGDQEDRQGIPFVGPAGKLLDQTLEELRIDRAQMYVTNAVKHFKFVQRGKLRLHQNPRMSEITACRPWLLAEIDAVKPEVVVCLGASAAKSMFGGTFELMKNRGKVIETPYAKQVIATLHPAAILRARDDEARAGMMEIFKADLVKAKDLTVKTGGDLR
jgi:probable DNA metabolism protein